MKTVTEDDREGLTDEAAKSFLIPDELWERLRPRHRHAVDRLAGQLEVDLVSPGDRQPDRHAGGLGQQRAFDPAFAAVHGAGSGFSPRPAEPW